MIIVCWWAHAHQFLFPSAVAGLLDWGASVKVVNVAPWRIPLRTALVRRRLDTDRWLRLRSLPFRVRKGGEIDRSVASPIRKTGDAENAKKGTVLGC